MAAEPAPVVPAGRRIDSTRLPDAPEAAPVSAPAERAVSSESKPNEYERAAAGEKVVFPMPESEQPHPVHGFGPIPKDNQE